MRRVRGDELPGAPRLSRSALAPFLPPAPRYPAIRIKDEQRERTCTSLVGVECGPPVREVRGGPPQEWGTSEDAGMVPRPPVPAHTRRGRRGWRSSSTLAGGGSDLADLLVGLHHLLYPRRRKRRVFPRRHPRLPLSAHDPPNVSQVGPLDKPGRARQPLPLTCRCLN